MKRWSILAHGHPRILELTLGKTYNQYASGDERKPHRNVHPYAFLDRTVKLSRAVFWESSLTS